MSWGLLTRAAQPPMTGMGRLAAPRARIAACHHALGGAVLRHRALLQPTLRALSEVSQQGGRPAAASRRPRQPLRERTPRYVTPIGTLQKVYEHMMRVTESVGHSLEEDGGPGPSDLDREMQYLWEDAVDAIAEVSAQPSPSADSEKGSEKGAGAVPWRAVAWPELSQLLASGGRGRHHTRSYVEVRLRADPGEIRSMWDRRILDREPLQYLTSSADWRDFVVSVGPGVLIPRPETEILVDLACDFYQSPEGQALADTPLADLGCGSGVIGLAMARSADFRGRVVAVDRSPDAVAHTRYNAERLGLQAKLDVRQGSWLEPIAADTLLAGKLGAIVSNPPYIPPARLMLLQAEVRDHEPAVSLDGGGEDGTSDLRTIIAGAQAHLLSGGLLALETDGGRQAHLIADVLKSSRDEGDRPAFRDVKVTRDYSWIDRFVTAIRT